MAGQGDILSSDALEGGVIMHDSDTEQDLAALRAIRRHLTVALLAVERLWRTTGALPPIHKLCGYATDALLRVRDEVAGIETRLRRRAPDVGPPPDATGEYPPPGP
jgi:hypothetical protein